MLRGYPKSDISCAIWESYQWVLPISICQMLSEAPPNHIIHKKEAFEPLRQQWEPILIVYHPISHSERLSQISYFVCNLRVDLSRNDTIWTIRSSKMLSKATHHLPYTSKEGYETLEQQWISLLLTPHSISCDEGVPRNQQFAWNLSVNRGRIGMVLARRGLLMLSQAHPTLFIHLRKVMDHFSSNGYLSSEHNISFFILRGYPKSSILCEIWMSILTGIAQFDTSGACRCCQKVV